uniref:Uncharacterized protein n=1 Tax=Anolis carolinensis TaxID=28377 RepID=A0A803TPE1_ANOCA
MEKGKGRMKKGAQNGKNPILQRNLLSSRGNLPEMKMTKTAKRKKTRAALMLGKPAMTRETPLQTRRKLVKGLNQHIDCCALREDTRRLRVWLSNILGFDRSQHMCSSSAYLFVCTFSHIHAHPVLSNDFQLHCFPAASLQRFPFSERHTQKMFFFFLLQVRRATTLPTRRVSIPFCFPEEKAKKIFPILLHVCFCFWKDTYTARKQVPA